MLCIGRSNLSTSSEKAPRIALYLVPYPSLESNTLFRPAAIDGVDRVRKFDWEHWWRDNLVSSDTLRQFGHFPQMIQLLGRSCLEPAVPRRRIKSH